jgi:hypothetical protein
MNIWNKSYAHQISQIYGTLIFLGLMLYFFLMYALGLIHVIELRFFNLLIMMAGIYYTIRQYSDRVHWNDDVRHLSVLLSETGRQPHEINS